MEKKFERRKSYRLPFNAKMICYANGKNYHGELRDMSVSGCFMLTSECPTIHAKCEIEIVLQGDNSRLKIDRLKGILVRCDEYGVGINFDSRLEWIALAPIYYHKMREQFES